MGIIATVLFAYSGTVLVILCITASTLQGAEKGLVRFFYPDSSKISIWDPMVWVAAVNQNVFSLGLGTGKVIIEKSRGEVSLMEQNTIENVS